MDEALNDCIGALVLNISTSAHLPLNHYWKPQTPKSFLRFEPQNTTQKISKQYTTNKYTSHKIFY